MKKLTMIFVFIAFTLVMQAQWYYNSFNVTSINDLNQDQLNLSLEKANQSIKTGQIMTGIGAGACIFGAIMYSNGLNNMVNSATSLDVNDGLNKGINGIYIAYAGGIIASIGIPIWISGFMKKQDIEVALVKFQPTGLINGIGVKIKF